MLAFSEAERCHKDILQTAFRFGFLTEKRKHTQHFPSRNQATFNNSKALFKYQKDFYLLLQKFGR